MKVKKVELSHKLQELAYSNKEYVIPQLKEEVLEWLEAYETYINYPDEPADCNHAVILLNDMLDELADVAVMVAQLEELYSEEEVKKYICAWDMEYMEELFEEHEEYILSVMNMKVERTLFRNKFNYYQRKVFK